jgi:hypothetical protein
MIPFGVFLYPGRPVWTPATRGRMDESAMKAKRYCSDSTDVKHFRASEPQLNILLIAEAIIHFALRTPPSGHVSHL